MDLIIARNCEGGMTMVPTHWNGGLGNSSINVIPMYTLDIVSHHPLTTCNCYSDTSSNKSNADCNFRRVSLSSGLFGDEANSCASLSTAVCKRARRMPS
jgi:hypothetical protein